eukprot:gene25728-biopygen10785
MLFEAEAEGSGGGGSGGVGVSNIAGTDVDGAGGTSVGGRDANCTSSLEERSSHQFAGHHDCIGTAHDEKFRRAVDLQCLRSHNYERRIMHKLDKLFATDRPDHEPVVLRICFSTYSGESKFYSKGTFIDSTSILF